MNEQLALSDHEWELVLDLLERERRELPTEIHHTDSHDYRHRLEERLEVVEALIRRIEATVELTPA